MTDSISNETYNEVFNAMKHNQSLKENIPTQIAIFLKSKSEQSQFNSEYSSEEDALLRMSKDALALYVLFYLKYSKASIEEKEKIKNAMVRNSMKNMQTSEEEYTKNLEMLLNNDIAYNEDLIVKRVREESEEKVKKIYNEGDLGFEEEVIEEMQKRLGELGIDWSPYIESEE